MPDLRASFSQREEVLEALDQSEIFFDAPSSRQWFPYSAPDREITHELMVETLRGLRRIFAAARNPDELNAWIRLAFDVYRSVGWDGSGEVLYTAYCEPIFEGSLEPGGEFRFPLYRLPDDLVKAEDGTPLGRRTPGGRIVPYWTRSEIETGNLLAGSELVYLRDPFEVYIAHVQGSARVDLPDGSQLCIGYAGKTDRPYTSIGLRLVEEGRISRSDLSLTALKSYFRQNPRELDRVLGVNESYVFFVEREPGPFGSIGVKVTPYHSLATDKSIFPRGGPCVVVTSLPVSDEQGAISRRPRTLLAFDQDTGGAIRSAGRADLFIGTGPEAELLAGYTREEGRLYYLFLKEGALLPSEDPPAEAR
jgi:membrane-bound lytic murein transglycosylase A